MTVLLAIEPMAVSKTGHYRRAALSSIMIVAAVVCDCRAGTDFYVRPAVQFTSLGSSARTSDAVHILRKTGFPASVTAGNYKASKNTVGAALGLGIIFGSDALYELGIELGATKFDGTYEIPELSHDFPPSSIYSDYFYPASTRKCTFSMRSMLATFRKKFGTQENFLRPYLECVGGLYDYKIKETERHPSLRSDPFDGKRDGGLIGAGMGASLRIFSHGDLTLGYRLTASVSSGDADFYKLAHSLTLGMALHF